MNIAQLRMQNQKLSADHLKTPLEVVRWFGAVQAQEYAQSLWAIGLRLPESATQQTIIDAINDRTIVRTWPMRGTIHFVPAEDAAWMTKLLARRVNRKFQSFLDKLQLTSSVLDTSRDVLMRSLKGGKQLIRKELYDALEQGGIDSKTGLHIMGYWAQEGLLCFGPYRDKQPTFVLLDEWVASSRSLEGDEALAEITKRYFTSHGPATIHDFAWWSGLSMAEARQGLELVKKQFISEELDGKQYWLTPPDTVSIVDSPLLLPCFDEYTVAYKDRSAAIDTDRLQEVGYAVNLNNIISDGRIIGSWKRTIGKHEVDITLQLLRPLTEQEQQRIQTAVQQYGHFLGLSAKIIS